MKFKINFLKIHVQLPKMSFKYHAQGWIDDSLEKKSIFKFDKNFNENDIIKKKKDQYLLMIKTNDSLVLIIEPFFLFILIFIIFIKIRFFFPTNHQSTPDQVNLKS